MDQYIHIVCFYYTENKDKCFDVAAFTDECDANSYAIHKQLNRDTNIGWKVKKLALFKSKIF